MEEFKECSYLPFGYTVNRIGQIKNKKGLIIKQKISNSGYFCFYVKVNKKGFGKFTHRAIAFAFLDLVDGKEFVNHIDGDKQNNLVENLEWCTKSENTKHAYKLGKKVAPLNTLGKFGAEHNRSKAVRCVETGEIFGSQMEAKRKLGISNTSVCWSIKNKKPIFGKTYEFV